MNKFSYKFKLIYLPFLYSVVFFAPVYTLLHWFFLSRFNDFHLNELVFDILFPIILAVSILPFILWPRWKNIKTKNKGDSGPWGYVLATIVYAVVTTMLAQFYLRAETGKLTVLDNINQIGQFPESTYYTIKAPIFDKAHAAFFRKTSYGGKGSEKFNYYIALPILSRWDDTLSRREICWLGYGYSRSASSLNSTATNDSIFNRFADSCKIVFFTSPILSYSFYEKLGNNPRHSIFNKTIHYRYPMLEIKQMVLIGHSELFSRRGKIVGTGYLALLISGLLIMLLVVSLIKLRDDLPTESLPTP